ncbi:MAG: DedA family protein [Planctomycetota bacterium]|jgi:membrane protein DedA with SNARE-associated domain
MEAFITENLSTYGPIAVFLLLMLSGVGISVTEDLITIPAGFLVGSGRLDLVPTLIAAWTGVVLSDCLWFALCSHYGTPLLHKRWFKRALHPRRLLQAKHQFEERGTWLIVMARFIPGSRTTAITVAGMLHMPFWKFAVTTVACTLITTPLQIGLGMLIHLGFGDADFADLLLRLLGLAVLLVAAALAWRTWRRHRSGTGRIPRARASWLRRFRVPHLRRGSAARTTLPIPGVPEPGAEPDADAAEPDPAAVRTDSREPCARS